MHNNNEFVYPYFFAPHERLSVEEQQGMRSVADWIARECFSNPDWHGEDRYNVFNSPYVSANVFNLLQRWCELKGASLYYGATGGGRWMIGVVRSMVLKRQVPII
jgi:hypothetical protein